MPGSNALVYFATASVTRKTNVLCPFLQTNQTTKERARLLTAVSGFPKQKSGYNIDNILKGQIGDDAYFIARHVDDWSNNNNNNNLKTAESAEKESESVEQLLNPSTTATVTR